MADPTLKRGRGLSFEGENWRLAGEARWEEHRVYVPNGREKFLGVRALRGVEHAVFRCMNDDCLAQPSEICELPAPADPTEVLSLKAVEEEGFGPPVE